MLRLTCNRCPIKHLLIMSKLYVCDRLLAAAASFKQCVEPQPLVPGIAQAIEPQPLREAAPPLRPRNTLCQAKDCTLSMTTQPPEGIEVVPGRL